MTAVIADGLTIPEEAAVWRLIVIVLHDYMRPCARLISLGPKPEIWVTDRQLFYSVVAFLPRVYPLKPFATAVPSCHLGILFCSKGRSSIEQDKEDELHRGDVVRVSDGCVKL